MKDANKTKKQLIDELKNLRQRVSDLEASEARRKRSEAALEESEERYRTMIENSPVAIMAVRNGCFLSVNPAGARLLGFSDPQEMVGIPALNFVAPESKSEVAERIRRLEEGKPNPPIQIKLIRQDGTRIIAESTSVSISISGRITAVIIAQDISERRQREEKLRMMQFSMDHALDRIAWIAPDGRLLYANKATCKEMGYTLEEALTMSIPDIDPNFPAERWAEHFQTVKKNGSVLFETQNISGDGKTHDVEVSTNYLKYDDHEFLCAFGRDITARKQAELKLKESEERFRAFMDNIPALAYIKDNSDRHIYANKATLDYLGRQPHDFIGRKSNDLWPTETARRLKQLDQKVLSENEPRVVEEWSHNHRGETHWMRDIKFPIDISQDEKLLGGIAIDITEHRRREKRLRRALAEIEELKDRLQAENIYLREEIAVIHKHEEIVGKSEAIQKVLSQAEQVADTDTTVLVLGETGTGKELLARAIHNISARKARSMIKVNCAALPPTLIESELFGREKGAYTGALTKQKGRFELADGSTIFLDEISELPLDLQPKLLRVLQEGRFERLGSSKTIAVNVRIIAATNQDLGQAVRNGRFREDLYYRVNVFPITMPPLRERQQDIPMLVWAFVKEFEKTMAKRIKSIPRKSMETLQRYPWPGNVRELRNVIEQAMIISKDKVLIVQLPTSSDLVTEPEIKLVDVERKHILKILQNTGWRIKGQNGAAELLGLHPATLYSRMKRLGIERSVIER